MELLTFQFCWQLEKIISKLVTLSVFPVSPEWLQKKQTSLNILTMETKTFSWKVKITQQNSQDENMEGSIQFCLFVFFSLIPDSIMDTTWQMKQFLDQVGKDVAYFPHQLPVHQTWEYF